MKNYLSALGFGAKSGLYFLLVFWLFVGLVVLVFGVYPKAEAVFVLACLLGVGLFFYLVITGLKALDRATRFFTALVLCGVFIFLNLNLIGYAVSVNSRTIVNCGKDAHEFFWSPLSSNCEKGFWYNVSPFNP